MADGEHCPRCGKGLVVHGSFITHGARFGFRPAELRLFALSFQFPEVPVSAAVAACAACALSGRHFSGQGSGTCKSARM